MKAESDVKAEAKDGEREMISRRDMIRQTAFTAMLLALPWKQAHALLLAPPKPPVIPFNPSKTGEGIVGPYGEVRILVAGSELLPIYIAAFDGSAVMDTNSRSPFIRFGTGSTAMVLTSTGLRIGTGKVTKWSPETVRQMFASFVQNRQMARSALLLRSALHSAYPLAASKSKTRVKAGQSRTGSAMSNGSKGMGSKSMVCTTKSVTEIVERTIVSTMETIRTAEQQHQACYDTQVAQNPCKAFGPGAGACAWTVCSAIAFRDIVVGLIEVVTTVAEEVTRQVVTCTRQVKLEWPNPWIAGTALSGANLAQPAMSFSAADITAALAFLKQLTGVFGPFGECLLDGEWNLAQLTTPLNFGDGAVTIPYGVQVCITSACATRLSADAIGLELLSSWGSALGALAALSPSFAVIAASVGIPATAVVATLAAAVPPAVLAAAALILAFIILALIYGTAIAGQLFLHKTFTNNFADGRVCIEHPTFAIGLIKMATLGAAPVELIPPIVTG